MRRTVVAVGILLLCTPALPVGAGSAEKCRGAEATIVGTNDDDVLEGTSQADVIVGLEGSDTITGLGRRDQICGGQGGDEITSGSARDFAYGGLGRDLVRGLAGNDLLDGGPGEDRVRGGIGDDSLSGGQTLEYQGHNQGDAKRDVLHGQQNYDTCYSQGNDELKDCELFVVE